MSVALVVSVVAMAAGLVLVVASIRSDSVTGIMWLVMGIGVMVGGYFLQSIWPWALGDGPTEVQVVDIRPLVSLANTTRISGTTFAVVERDTLTFVAYQDDGAYALERIPAEGVRILEDADETTARIETTACVRTSRGSVILFGERCSEETVTVHLPAGTVSRDFTIDPSRE